MHVFKLRTTKINLCISIRFWQCKQRRGKHQHYYFGASRWQNIFTKTIYVVHYTTSQMLCTLSLYISVFCNRINENRVNAFIELIKMLANNILKTYRL